MKLKNKTKEELELLSYTDLTELILKENKKPMNTPAIFKSICEMLEYSDSEYTNKIGEFYTSLTTDKRFVFLDTAEWDLKDNHSIPLIIDDDEDMEEEIEVEEETTLEENIEDEEDLDSIEIEDDLDDDDDIDDLAIVDDEELDEEN
ncbi:MAG: DNA-directed RNA polymerase subunit delta [Firmicutes bacterium]|nr:DNA-directed RNA polymerase subunit delta [Bacillota bacterium]